MNVYNSFLLIATLGLFSTSSLYSQSSTGKSAITKLSLQECISRAKTNSFQKKQAQFLSKISKNNLQNAHNEKLPKVSGNLVNYLNSGRSIDRYTNLFTEETIANQSYGLDVEIPIYQGNQIKNNILINEINANLAENELRKTEQNLTIDVLTSFLGVLNAEEQWIIAKQQVEVSKNQLNRLELLSKEGLTTRMSILEFKMQLSNDELQEINAENEYILSKTRLLQIMNEPNIIDIEIDRKSIETNNIGEYKTPITNLLSYSLTNNPSIKNAKGLLEISNLNINISRAMLMPTVGFGVNLGSNFSSEAPKERFIYSGRNKIIESPTNDYVLVNNKKINLVSSTETPMGYFKNIGYFGQLGLNFNTVIYLNIKIPIYDGGISKKRIENAQIMQKISKIQIDESEIKLKQIIELAYKNMKASYKRYIAINKQVIVMEELFLITKKQILEGTISSTDYMAIKSQYDKVKQNQILYKYDYILRTKILDFYVDSL